MRILFLHRQHTAIAYYRTYLPARALRSYGHEVTTFNEPYIKVLKPTPAEWIRQNAGKYDLLIVDRSLNYEDLGLWAGLRYTSPGMRMIVDFDDDYQQVPPWNPAAGAFQSGQPYREAGNSHLKLAELTTVSTPVLAERFKKHTHAVRTCLNMIDPADWSNFPVDPERRYDPHLRVLYGGASGHFGDLDDARQGLEAVLNKPPVPFRLICFGAIPFWLHETRRKFPERVVSLPWVPFDDYPAVVAWGGFDLAIAPLAEHPFNRAKSNIKWLEAACQGQAFLCSKVGPYAEIPDGCAMRVDNTAVQWADGLRTLLQDADLRRQMAQEALAEVQASWTIDQRRVQWQDAVEDALSRPRIEKLEDTRLPHEQVRPGSPAPGPGST